MDKNPSYESNLTPDDTVVLYPSYGQLDDDGRHWRISVQGAVFEPGELTFRKRMLIRLLQKVMQAEPQDLQTEIFQERIRGFAAVAEPDKQVVLQIGERTLPLRKGTKRNGQFAGAVRLPVEIARELADGGSHGDDWIPISVIGANGMGSCCDGRVQLLNEQGVSVITDIDDTIKQTHVNNRRELLESTFLREFRSVDGMADLYRQWEQQGAAFHYVSSSPWQLFEPLYQMRQSAGFPEGSFHLRSFRLRDHMLRRVLLIRRPGKSAVIRKIVAAFSNRRFVLVGDSGEKDPEIYGEIARRFPERVAAVYIRDLDSRKMTEARCRKVFRGLDFNLYRLFRNPGELPPIKKR